MALPERVAAILASWGVGTDVRARLAEHHRFLGQPAIDAFVDLVESGGRRPDELEPADLDGLRARAGERYLGECHAKWLAREPTPGFWRDRTIEGAPAGLVTPLGDLAAPHDDLTRRISEAAALASGPDQPRPQGMLLLSRNAHYGNRPGEFSVDLVPSTFEHACAVNRGVGQQHTLPGSIGEASGTATGDPPVAVLWEIQPNIYKPSADRNREANAAWRKHRNWHLMTSIGALAWLLHNGYRVHVLRAEALQLAHEVNPDKPVSADIEAFHERTLGAALEAMGLRRRAPDDADAASLGRTLDVTLSHRREGRAIEAMVDRVG